MKSRLLALTRYKPVARETRSVRGLYFFFEALIGRRRLMMRGVERQKPSDSWILGFVDSQPLHGGGREAWRAEEGASSEGGVAAYLHIFPSCSCVACSGGSDAMG